MNTGNKGNYSIKLDRLSICYNEPNQEYVQKTCGLLVSDHIQDTPWLTVTKNARYAVSCRISVPFKGGPSKHTVCFEAGPRRPGQASYRLDYNPAKICETGFDDLTVFLEGIFDPDVVGFYRAGKVTRCDLALDLFGHQHEDFIVRSSRLQKHGVYSDRHGYVQTTYLGTPKSRRIVAYEKSVPGSLESHLRLECRLKPGFFGFQVAKLENPFSGIGLIPADFPETAGIDIPAQFIADSIRIGGLKRALRALDPAQRKTLKQAFKAAESVLPSLDALWASWPETLIGLGLGKHLGACLVVPFAKAA